MNKIALGCSHTYGVGVNQHDSWPNLLGAINLGIPGNSADQIARTLPLYLKKYQPNTVYILWPDWTRFEYFENGEYHQSLPTDSNRIYFMEKATDEWLKENFLTQIKKVRTCCTNIKCLDLTLYDLITFIDHADTWPLSKLGHHYSEEWHQWVADIFENKAEWITDHRLFA